MIVPALAFLAAMSAGVEPAPYPEQASVLRAILAHHAGNLHLPHRLPAGRTICVAPRLTAPPLSGRLDAIRRQAQTHLAQGAEPAAPAPPATIIDEQVRRELWLGNPRGDTAEGKPVVDAAYALAATPAPAGPASIDRAWLSGGERLDDSDSCREHLTLSRPAIKGDIAFVEVDHKCGALCGLQATILLRRRGDGDWRVAGGDIHLIS